MRKSFKVATVLTGTAACAGAFAPAAGPATMAKPELTMSVPFHENCTVGPETTSMVFTWSALV